MKCSIVMATYNRVADLDETLRSIISQRPPFDVELIVVDNGSTPPLAYQRITWPEDGRLISVPPPHHINPAHARNVGMKAATGEVLILQSDEVIHAANDAIERLVNDLRPGEFQIATVWNKRADGLITAQYTGRKNQRPFFFLGAVYREDVFAIGGNSEDFIAPGYDDNWFGDCLINGRGLTPVYTEGVIGYHQDHERPENLVGMVEPSRLIYERKVRDAQAGRAAWRGGEPWHFQEVDNGHETTT